MILTVPELEQDPWPTLGPQVAAFIEAYLVHGPGDLLGKSVHLDDEKRAILYRAYEVYPKDHPRAGRRRFKRVALSVRKGWAKTETAAWIAACELHPDGPVRCDGFDANGEPVGVGLVDPFIPMVAYTEEQSDELAFGALRQVLAHSDLADDFDIGLERVMRISGAGKAVAVASAPDGRDGARTTHQLFDETHRFTLPRLRSAHRTMLANVPKRRQADAWSLETTTSYAPGEGSVAEATMEYARAVRDGRITDSTLFFFHRQASPEHDLSTAEGIRAAVLEASGPVAAWSDVDAIVEQFADPTADRQYLCRVWLNQVVRSALHAFDAERWKALADPGHQVPDGTQIVLGFDGSRRRDATALVGTEIPTGFQWVLGLWERPLTSAGRDVDEWEVPVSEVNAVVESAHRRFRVWRMYGDPPYWEEDLARWAGQYGDEVVVAWPTNTNRRKVAGACRAYGHAIIDGKLTHSGDPAFTRHIGNAHRHQTQMLDDDGQPLWTIEKEQKDSPNKIDAAMAGVLSWAAYLDALEAGVAASGRSAYEDTEEGLTLI